MFDRWLMCTACGQIRLADYREKDKACKHTEGCTGIIVELGQYVRTLIRYWEEANHVKHYPEQKKQGSLFLEQIEEIAKTNKDVKRIVVHVCLEAVHDTPSHLHELLEKLETVERPEEYETFSLHEKCQYWCDWGKRAGRLWLPAVAGDIIEVIESHYACSCEVGERYIVLGVMDDDTAFVLHPDGSVRSLCFPEEYIVVDTMENCFQEKMHHIFPKKKV